MLREPDHNAEAGLELEYSEQYPLPGIRVRGKVNIPIRNPRGIPTQK